MATLPELVATPVTITLKGHEFTAKPLTVLQNAEIGSSIDRLTTEKGEGYAVTYTTVKFIEGFLKSEYPDVTEDYVAELISGESSEVLADIVKRIGRFDPKVPTGVPSSPDLSTEPAGLPTPSEA